MMLFLFLFHRLLLLPLFFFFFFFFFLICFFFSILVCLFFFCFSLTCDRPNGHQIRLWRGCRPTFSLSLSWCVVSAKIPSDVTLKAVLVSGFARRCVEHLGEQGTVLAVALSRGEIRNYAVDLRCASLWVRLLLCNAVLVSLLHVGDRTFGSVLLVTGVNLGRRIGGDLFGWSLRNFASFFCGRCYPGTQCGRYVLQVDLDAVEVRTWVSLSWKMCSADLLRCPVRGPY